MENEKHDNHYFIITTLSVLSLGLLAILGYFAYDTFLAPQEEIVTQQTESLIDLNDAFLEETDAILEANETTNPQPQYGTVAGSSISPAFEYPVGWHVYQNSVPGELPGLVSITLIDQNPIHLLEGDPTFQISINTFNTTQYDLQGNATYLAYFDQLDADPQFFSETERTTVPTNGGTKTTIKADVGGFVEGKVEHIIFEKGTSATNIRFFDNESTTADNVAWENFKTSLDFSTIQ